MGSKDRTPSRWRLLGVLAVVVTAGAALLIVDSVGLLAQPSADSPDEPTVRMTFFNQTWDDVLERVATDTGSTLVVHDLPPGRYSRLDRKKYSRHEALKLINRELEPEGFRVLEKGRYLMVLHDERVRPKYPAPELVGRRPSPIRTASATDEDLVGPAPAPAPVPQPATADENSYDTSIPIALARTQATPVAKSIHEALGSRSRLVKAGPNNLPAFRVTLPNEGPRAQLDPPTLVVEIDTRGNRLITSGPVQETSVVAALVRSIDESAGNGQTIKLLDGESPAGRIAQRIEPVRKAIGPQPKRRPSLFAQADVPQPGVDPRDPGQPPVPPGPGEPVPPEGGRPPLTADDLPALIGELRSDVALEILQELGVIILSGNERDIEEVLKVVRQIELLSRGSTPDILLLKLQNVDSEALADLLNAVYEQLDAQRVRANDRKTVTVIPVVRPNAVLVIAPEAMMESIQGLASQLDEPVDPRFEVQIFRLRSAVPEQVVTLVEDFYEERGGLGTRVKIAPDSRTNSVIVMARPNDLVEVDHLIRGIDRKRSQAVTRVRVFPLRNAVATELAETMTDAIDSILGGGAGGGGAAGDFAAAKSVVLEYLAVEGPDSRRLRSGLLADVRINADARSNSLLITAPAASIELIEALIERLDLPSSSVAEIKVFNLENADATATADLLEALFEQQDEGDIGVQLAGASDAQSSLVPMRFSVDVRTNSVVAFGGADALAIVEAIILRLDGTDARQRKSTVVRLQNSPATEIAIAINNFLDSQRELASVDPDLVSNVELLEREIIVVDEPISNSLLISATPRYYDEIRRMVNELDAAPRQVVIQALLVEVVLDNTDEFGVELGFQDSTLFDRSVTAAEDLVTLTTTNSNPGTGIQTTTQNIVSQSAQPGFLFANPNTPLGNNAFGTGSDPAAIGTQGLSNFSLGRVNSDLGYGGLVFSASSASVNILVRALAARRNVHILSRPQIRTLDNLVASIQVGQEVPVVSDVAINQTTGGVTPIVTPDEAGIILTVTPRIRDDGEIVMEVIAEKSQFDFGAGPPLFVDTNTGISTNSTVKDITTAATTVSVPDGQTVVIGGMITKTDATLERKVPWFGDLPLLGSLFRYDSTQKQRTELLIFLTPRVLDGPADSEVIKQIEAGRMHYVEEDAEAIHGPLFSVPGTGMPFNPYGPPEGPEYCPPGFDGTPLPIPEGSWDGDIPTTTMPSSPTRMPESGPPGDDRMSLGEDRYGRRSSRLQ